MKNIFFYLILSQLAILLACSGDNIDLPDEILAGKINGVDWEFRTGSVSFTGGNGNQYLLFSTLESTDQGCSLVSSTNPYLSIKLPTGSGNYSIPIPPNQGDNVKFIHGDGTILSATSGFVEIVGVNQGTNELVGYLQALFDDNNTVQGTFRLEVC